MARSDPSPTLDSVASLNADGSRKFVHPADVEGKVTSVRKVVFAFLLILLIGTPWVRIGGHPAVLLDIPRRQFYLLGEAYNAQDAFLIFFLLTGVGFALVVTTSLFGRMWCGFACPQTVFVDGVFRKVERLFEGPAQARIKLDAAPWTPNKIARKTGKHVVYGALALLIAHNLLGYFFPIRELWTVINQGPGAHLEAFLWTMGIAGVLYFDFAWFREQFCVIMCPYGRLQSALTDRDTIVIGYDVKRGEPRGKLKVLGNGDCVDCKRCIAVCPTGIDIRQGMQLDCVGCGACIDACDEVMFKIDKPKGLIRFDSQNGFEGKPTRLLRGRTIAYFFAGLAGLAALSFALLGRTPFEATLLRSKGAPYLMDGGEIRNVLRVHLVNKRAEPMTLHLEPLPTSGVTFLVPQPDVPLAANGNLEVPVIISTPASSYQGPSTVQLKVTQGKVERLVSTRFVGPGR